jgi:hypothetical protein
VSPILKVNALIYILSKGALFRMYACETPPPRMMFSLFLSLRSAQVCQKRPRIELKETYHVQTIFSLFLSLNTAQVCQMRPSTGL